MNGIEGEAGGGRKRNCVRNGCSLAKWSLCLLCARESSVTNPTFPGLTRDGLQSQSCGEGEVWELGHCRKIKPFSHTTAFVSQVPDSIYQGQKIYLILRENNTLKSRNGRLKNSGQKIKANRVRGISSLSVHSVGRNGISRIHWTILLEKEKKTERGQVHIFLVLKLFFPPVGLRGYLIYSNRYKRRICQLVSFSRCHIVNFSSQPQWINSELKSLFLLDTTLQCSVTHSYSDTRKQLYFWLMF